MTSFIKRAVIVFIFLLLLIPVSFSQEVALAKNEFGVHLGACTSMGLSYRHWFGKVGVQLTALPIKLDNYQFYSGGCTFLYSVYNSKYIHFFGYCGGHYTYLDDNNEDEWFNEKHEASRLNIGIGPGFAFGRVMRINVMAGYGMYDVTGKFNTFLTGELGLYYSF
jgi:hypothetical protein